MIDSDNERMVSPRWSLAFGGVWGGKGLGLRESGGFGSFLCVANGVFGLAGGLIAVGGSGEDAESNAVAVADATSLLGVCGSDIPRPGGVLHAALEGCGGLLSPLPLLLKLDALSLSGVGGRCMVIARKS